LLERDGRRYLLVDTAGIRRSRHLKENVDHVSVVLARRSLERAEVAVLVLDAAEGVREMDATIGGYVAEAGRAVVLAVNKWDLKDEHGLRQRKFEEDLRDRLKFLPYAKIVFVSARTGRGLAALLQQASRARESWSQRVTTGELNRLLAQAQKKQAPKAKGSHAITILFGAQVGIQPPTFALSINQPVDLHFSYQRYLENQIRARFGFEGTPIVLKVRFRRH
jgi:GTP-binding protein